MENKHTIYFNMCNHYRKLYHVKACVDTSAPKSKKKTKSLNTGQNIQNKATKNNDWKCSNLNKSSGVCLHPTGVSCNLKSIKTISTKATNNCSNVGKQICSNIRKLETPASKFSYFLPNKRIIGTAEQAITKTRPKSVNNKNMNKLKLSSLSIADTNSCYYSGDSSDSAFNEGEGILSEDSRGSTPKQLVRNFKTANKILPQKLLNKNKDPNIESRSNEILYIQFLKNITNDILKQNVFTNKALKNIFEIHLEKNLNLLDETKMLHEINKLKEELGVPKEDKFNSIGFGLGNIDYDFSVHKNPKLITENKNSTTDTIESPSHATEIGSIDNDYTNGGSETNTTHDYSSQEEEEQSNKSEEGVVENKNEGDNGEIRKHYSIRNVDDDNDEENIDSDDDSYSDNFDQNNDYNANDEDNDSSNNYSSNNISTIEEEDTAYYIGNEGDTDSESEIHEEIN